MVRQLCEACELCARAGGNGGGSDLVARDRKRRTTFGELRERNIRWPNVNFIS